MIENVVEDSGQPIGTETIEDLLVFPTHAEPPRAMENKWLILLSLCTLFGQ
jgi:hypothetical protein